MPTSLNFLFDLSYYVEGTFVSLKDVIMLCRYVDGGGLAEQQAALLHYQQDNLLYLSQEV
jgi:hypothetical protein